MNVRLFAVENSYLRPDADIGLTAHVTRYAYWLEFSNTALIPLEYRCIVQFRMTVEITLTSLLLGSDFYMSNRVAVWCSLFPTLSQAIISYSRNLHGLQKSYVN